MVKENQRFSVWFTVSNHYHKYYGCEEFIVKNDVIYAIDERVDIDLENSDEYCTQYKYVRELPVELNDLIADRKDGDYKRLLQWVNTHPETIFEVLESGAEFEDFGKYAVKVFSPRPLLEVGLTPENYARLRGIEKVDAGNREFVKAMLDRLCDHAFMLKSLTIKGVPDSVRADIEHCRALLC